MTQRRPPWWLYLVAASFCGYFALTIYLDFRGPEQLGATSVFRNGQMIVGEVLPDSPGGRGGLRPGDRVLAVEGQPIRSRADWNAICTNFEVGSPRQLEIERSGKPLKIVVTPGRGSWNGLNRPNQLVSLLGYGGRAFCLLLALVIAFRRPRDPVALLGACLLAATTGGAPPGDGFATVWRRLPAPLEILLWASLLIRAVIGPLGLTFFALFPRKLFRSPWPLVLVWAVGAMCVFPGVLRTYRMLYVPEHVTGMSQLLSSSRAIVSNLFILGGLLALVMNYRRLTNLNERRRVRVLVVGMLVGTLGFLPIPVIGELFPNLQPAFFSTPVPVVSSLLFLLIPLSFAYAILRHRLFDIRIMLRQGLQYALARGFIVWAVPALGAILSIDLWLHADEPLRAILRFRGWTYAGLAGVALLAFVQRRSWLESLDRRFFRERYNAQRLLRDVVEEIRVARNLEQEAPGVVAHIEAALHPEFVAVLAREADEEVYRTLAAAPTGYEPIVLGREQARHAPARAWQTSRSSAHGIGLASAATAAGRDRVATIGAG